MRNEDSTRNDTAPPELRAAGEACLVVIHTPEPTLLGKRVVLDHGLVTVGRAVGNDIPLDDDSVSRHHAVFERRDDAWFVVDKGSVNGTYCEDVRVSPELALENGARIRIGQTIFKFLESADVEALFHEEIHKLSVFDALTRIHNRRFLHDALEREILRARKAEHGLALLLFDVDYLKRINEVHERVGGDFVLEELAALVQTLVGPGDIFARYGGQEFCLALPATDPGNAFAFADMLRRTVQEHPFEFAANRIQVTITVGVASLTAEDSDANAFLERATKIHYIASRQGRNRTVSDVGGSLWRVGYRRLLDGASFLQKALHRRLPTAIVAFEIEDETAIVEQLGWEVLDAWFRHLVQEVEGATSSNDLVGTWRERYVLSALDGEDGDAARRLIERVRGAWTALPLANERRFVSPRLRAAELLPDELRRFGDRALDELLRRLVPRKPAETAPEAELMPFPLAVLRPMVSTRRTTLGRVITLLDGIETALRFVVAVEIAAIRDHAELRAQSKAAGVVAKAAKRSIGWENCAVELAPLVPSLPSAAVARSVRAFADMRVRGALQGALAYVARLRLAVSRQAGRSEDAFGPDEPGLRELLDAILMSLEPLSATELVSVAEIDDVDDDDLLKYGLFLHRGTNEHPPIVPRKLSSRLQKRWCYLLAEGESRAPLSLAPFIAAQACDICGRLELSIFDSLVVGPPGTKVRARGVTSSHEAELVIPEHKGIKLFHDLVRTRHEDLNSTEATLQLSAPVVDAYRRALGLPTKGDAGPPPSESGPDSVTHAAAAPPPMRRADTTPSRGAKVVILSAEEDVQFVRDLETHLVPLQRNGAVRVWHEKKIGPGEALELKLSMHLQRADLVVILTTARLLASRRAWNHVENALFRAERGEIRVIPVLIEDCSWKATSLGKLVMMHDRSPIAASSNAAGAWSAVVAGVQDAVIELSESVMERAPAG